MGAEIILPERLSHRRGRQGCKISGVLAVRQGLSADWTFSV